jgi:hypothetical protein
MTIPFLSVKPRSLKLKVVPKYPANLFGGTGIDVVKVNGNYTVDLDYTDFPQVSALPPTATNALIYDPVSKTYVQAPVSLFGGSGGAGISEAPQDGTTYGRNNAAWVPASPTTTRGDIIARGVSADLRLPIGTSGYLLQSNGVDPVWSGFAQAGTGTATRTWQDKARETYSVKDFGASGNDIAVTATITINSGSPNLTATGAAFVAGDVGKQITIPGAGVSGGLLQTTIQTFTDATHVVLAANAGTAVSAVSTRISYGIDDTTAINNAIAAAATGAGINFPPGAYRVSTLTPFTKSITLAGTHLSGCIIRSYVTTGDIISTTGTLTFRDLTIDSIGNRTSGYSLNLGGNGSLVANFAITNCYIGILSNGVLNRIQEGNISPITSRAISAGSGGVLNTGTILAAYNVAVGSGTSVNANMAEFGFKVLVGELDATQCYAFQVNQGVSVTPGASQTVLGVNLKGCWFDTVITYGVNITPAAASAIVSYVWITDCWLAPGSNSANGYGLVVDNTAGASLTKIWVSNSYILTYGNNQGNGVYLVGANLEFSMVGGQIGGQNFGFSVGINATANTTKWSFVGVAVTYNGTGFTFAAGADNYVFNSNRIQNNSSAGSDSSTPTAWSISGNIGYDPPWRAYTPSAAAASGSLTPGSTSGKSQISGKTVVFFASVNISNIGSGTVAVDVGLPYPCNGSFVLFGRDQAFGPALQGVTGVASASTVRLTKVSDNSFPAANGSLLLVSGTYERT